MKYLNNELLIPFNVKDKNGMWFDIDSYDWNKLKQSVQKSLFGKIGHTDGTIQLSDISHQIINIYIKPTGVYGDIRVLEFGYGKSLGELINNGYEFVFRNAGITSYNSITGYCSFYEFLGFNAILKCDDVYDQIIWRSDKIKKILSNIN